MSRNLTAAGCSSGEHVAACQCDVCLLRSELAEARSMHQDTLRAFEKYEQTTRDEHAAALAEFADEKAAHDMTRDALKAAVDEWNAQSAALGLATARIRELEGERAELLGLLNDRQRLWCPVVEYPKGLRVDKCSWAPPCWEHRRRAIVARIEKATKGTT